MGMMSRRTILKAASALPVAAIPAVGLPIAAATPIEAVVAPVIAAKHPWKWWVSYDGGEVYQENFQTRERALEFASGEYGPGATVAECQQQDFDLTIEPWRVLERLQEDNEDIVGEGDFFSCTDDQEKDLGKMLTATMHAWAEKHKLDLTAWTFGEVRNLETIPDKPAPQAPAGCQYPHCECEPSNCNAAPQSPPQRSGEGTKEGTGE